MKQSRTYALMAAVCTKMAVDYGQMSAAEAEKAIAEQKLSEEETRIVAVAHQLLLADCPPGGRDKRNGRLSEYYLSAAAEILQAAGQA